MSPSCFIFDFDGTLADTFQATLRISNRLAEQYRFKKIEEHEVDFYRDRTSQEMVRLLGVPRFKIARIVTQAARELHTEMQNIQPFPDLKETLSDLHNSGITLGILTSNSTENVQRFLNLHGLDFFDHIVASSKIWGKNRRLVKMIKGLGFKKEDIVYIGDETRDVEAAHKAGVKVAAVTWGYNSHKALMSHNPHYIVDKPQDLLHISSQTS